MTNEGKAIEIMADFPNDHTQLSQEMYDAFLERISQMAEWKSAVMVFANRLKEEYKQSTVTIVFTDCDIEYIS